MDVPLAPPVAASLDDHFRIDDPAEIGALVRDIVRAQSLVTATFGEDDLDAFLTVVTAADAESDTLEIDAPVNPRQRRLLLAAARVHLSYELQRVRHRFTAYRPWEPEPGGPTIRLTMPDVLLRFQRREYFRIEVPLGSSLEVRLPSPRHGLAKPLPVRVLDISLGGIGVRMRPPHPFLELGMVIPDVAIDLPDVGIVDVSLEVRNLLQVAVGGRQETRIGFRFAGMHPTYAILVQRYINALQARRRLGAGR